jgi:hypothetical protein
MSVVRQAWELRDRYVSLEACLNCSRYSVPNKKEEEDMKKSNTGTFSLSRGAAYFPYCLIRYMVFTKTTYRTVDAEAHTFTPDTSYTSSCGSLERM